MKRKSSVMLRNVKMLLALLVVYATPILGSASTGGGVDLPTLAKEADLIFKGTLNDISNGLSLEGIPYTFVTYSVDEVIAGKYQEGSITLKFVGGVFANGNRLRASNSPDVTLGEEAILFVQQRTDTGCDFARCEHGRFLLNNGNIIAANGLNHKKTGLSQFKSNLVKLSAASDGLKIAVTNTNKHAAFKAFAGLTQAGQAPKMLDSQPANKKTDYKVGENGLDPHSQYEMQKLIESNGNPVFK